SASTVPPNGDINPYGVAFVPGWLDAGPLALGIVQRFALATWHARRTFTRDVNATILDLFGVLDSRSEFPFGDRLFGRSLLRLAPAEDAPVPMSTASGVCDADDPKYGIMEGDVLAVHSAGSPWVCYDAAVDPRQRKHLVGPTCQHLAAIGERTFAHPL
ncbi:MAG: hypothetical protein ACREJ3_15915, partial [Polyangiaceae bacterium]